MAGTRQFKTLPVKGVGFRKLTPSVFNHELWRVCANCGEWLDARMGLECSACGFTNDI